MLKNETLARAWIQKSNNPIKRKNQTHKKFTPVVWRLFWGKALEREKLLEGKYTNRTETSH